MQRLQDKWDILGVTLLIGSLIFLNYFTSFNFLLPKALAEGSDGKLDITFISSGYKDSKQFNKDVDLFEKHLLTYEPFKTRRSQILFHRMYNTVDLQCSGSYVGGVQSSRYTCNNGLVFGQVNNASVPYDLITVVANTKWGGSASRLAGNVPVVVASNRDKGPTIFVYELGVALAYLLDEDVVFGNKKPLATNQVRQNCYSGTPTREVWPGIPLSQYYKGCVYANWYRSSESSIMRSLDSRYFNLVSQRLLDKQIDFYAGPLIGSQPTATKSTLTPTIAVPNIPTSSPTPIPILLSPSPTPTPLKPQKAAESPKSLEANCTVTCDWTNYVKRGSIKEGPPYTVEFTTADGKTKLDKVTTSNTKYTFINLPPGDTQYQCSIFDIRGLDSGGIGLGGYIASCPTPPIPTPIEAKPTIVLTSAPTLSRETPTFTPPPPQKREIKSITIYGLPIDDIDNPAVDLRLPGTKGKIDQFVIPVIITYSYGPSKTINLVFNYTPPPTPTSIPSYTPCVYKCNRFATDWEKKACLQVCEDPQTKYTQCVNQCELFPKENRQDCLRVCDTLLTPTPTPTSTPTPTPVGCNCDISQKDWVSYGGCGYLGCAANEMPQYRTCDTTLSCPIERQCTPDATCPTLTPTITPGFCSSYKDNIGGCMNDNRCKWTFTEGNRCVDR